MDYRKKGNTDLRKIKRIFFTILCLCLLAGNVSDTLPRGSAASAMTASSACVEFIKAFEGFSPQPYYDYKQYTVGYGTKCPTEKYFVYTANGIPKKEAEALLRNSPSLAKIRKKRIFKLFFKMSLVEIAILGLTGYLYYSTNQIALAVVGVGLVLFALYKIADPRKNFKRGLL